MNLDTLLDPLLIGILVVMTVLYPWIGIWEFRRLARWNAENVPDARVRHYNWIGAWEWIAVAVFLFGWFAAGRQAAALGLVRGPSGWQWLAVFLGFVLCAWLVVQMVWVTRRPDTLREMGGKLGDLAGMAPRNAREQRAFDRLSITAGICEEILYRGMILSILVAAIVCYGEITDAGDSTHSDDSRLA